MGKIGKISIIPKDYSGAFPTMEKSLRDAGYSRMPGTVVMKFPYKELNGKYRTGLDENAASITKISDLREREAEQKRIKEKRKKLEDATGIDLGPTAEYWNYNSRQPHHVEPTKLADGENIFNLDDPWQEITFLWLKAHPTIASSLQAWEKGQYPSETQFYVSDEDLEAEILYKKKKTANDAIIRFDSWSLDKRRKVARLLDLPIGEDTKEEMVYNMVDTFLKQDKVNHGVHKDRSPIVVFGNYADLRDNVIYIKDLMEQSIRDNVYKVKKGGRVYEGELEVFKDKQEMEEFFLNDNNQEDLLELEKKLKLKKFAEV